MEHAIRPSSLLPFLAMLLLTACRTAHRAAREEAETHTAATACSSVSDDSSFTSLFHALSLDADSIVLWLQDSGPAPEDVSGTDCTAQCSAGTHRVAKVLIAGAHLEAQAVEEMVSSSHVRDSLSDSESQVSSLTEREESKPAGWSVRSLILAVLLTGGMAILAFLGLRSVLGMK